MPRGIWNNEGLLANKKERWILVHLSELAFGGQYEERGIRGV